MALMTAHVITKDPKIPGGVPVFSGTRVPFQALLDYIQAGETLDDFLDDFPAVTRDAAIAALEQAKALVSEALQPSDKDEFLMGRTFDQLRAIQNVQPLADISTLSGVFSESDNLDEMLDEIYRERT